MADTFPQNIPSDDAALMADDSSGDVHPASVYDNFDDDDDETEDPTGKGSRKKHPSGVFMYNRPKEVLPQRQVRGGAFAGKQFKQTPGSKRIQP